jgi:hypothetical protein
MVIEEGKLNLESSPYSIFILSIRSQVTKGKYLQRIGYFLHFVGVKQGTIEERCNLITWMARNMVCMASCNASFS